LLAVQLVAGRRHTLYRGRRSESRRRRWLPYRGNRALALLFSRGSRQWAKHRYEDEQCAENRPHRWIGSSPRFHSALPNFRKTLPHHAGILAQQAHATRFF
jgi:hypothetical protein